MTTSSDELWEARFNVKRAVLDCVAYDYHDEPTASSVHHGDYLEDMLDEALKEYAEAYLKDQAWMRMEELRAKLEEEMKKPQKIVIHDPKNEYYTWDYFLNRRAD